MTIAVAGLTRAGYAPPLSSNGASTNFRWRDAACCFPKGKTASARETSRSETPHFPERAFRPISTLGACRERQ
jgi:hypothetical protein